MIVYKITNKTNGKVYVGQTVCSLKQRWQRHCWSCTADKSNMPISKAIKKYGKENFILEIICECQSLEELNEKEKYYANLYKSFSPNGYNLKAGNGPGAMSEETKEKIRIANTGKTRTPETLKLLSKSHMGFVVSEETKRKISLKNKGRPTAEITKRRCSEVCTQDYELVSPEGIILKIHGITKFCKDNGYCRSKMSELVHGKREAYRGWTRTVKVYGAS